MVLLYTAIAAPQGLIGKIPEIFQIFLTLTGIGLRATSFAGAALFQGRDLAGSEQSQAPVEFFAKPNIDAQPPDTLFTNANFLGGLRHCVDAISHAAIVAAPQRLSTAHPIAGGRGLSRLTIIGSK
jgi:hypothetical protein